MAYKFDEKSVIAAYNRLAAEQKERFIPGQEEEAKKIIGSLVYLLGSNCKYDQLLDLFITVAVRVMMGFENERVNITVKMRFSDIVPQEKALTVIECIRRIVNNHSFIDGLDSPEIKAHDRFFDSQNQDSFKRNEKRLNDAAEHPGFGTTMDNPIFAHSAAGSYSYLNLLYTSDGVPVTWNRVGSMSPRSGDTLDKYELFLPDGSVYLTVFVNMYSKKSSTYCPCGLMGKGLKEAPRFTEPEPEDDEDYMDYDFDDAEEESEENEYLAFLNQYSKDKPSPKADKTRKQKEESDKKSRGQKATSKPETEKETPLSSHPVETISETSMIFLQGNLPLLVEKSTITKNSNGNLYAVCSFRSLTEKSIRAMQVDILCYDVWKESIQSVKGFQYNDLKTQRDTSFGTQVIVPLPDNNTRSISVVVQKLMLEDGTLLIRSEENILIPRLELIDDVIGRDLGNEYRKLTYNDAKYVPGKFGSCWRCTCGELNSNDEANCHLCKKDQTVLLSCYDEKDLQKSLGERRRLQKKKEEKERLAREEERRAREQKEAEEARARAEKKRKRKIRTTVGCIIVAVAAVAVYLVVWQIIPSNKYKEANAFLKSGNRDAAYSAFLELGTFKDSENRAAAIKYEDGNAALESGDYDKAYELFTIIPEYNDSAIKAKEAVYLKATRLMEEKSYTDAAKYFDSVNDYQDSEEQALFCRNEQAYQDALALFEKQQYKEAGELLETIVDYRDSVTLMTQAYYLYAKDLIEQEKPHDAYIVLSDKVNRGNNGYEDSVDLANAVEYQYASDCFSEGKYADAAESFANLNDYNDSVARSQESRYQHGLILIAEGEYDEAEKLFTELGEYKDSAAKISESIYQHGVSLLDSEKYDDAVEILGQLTNYRDSATKLNEAKYQKGLQLLKKQNFNDAEEIFTELGYYRDSQTQLSETKYQHAQNLVRMKKFQEAADLFKELGYYSDSLEQWKSAMYSYVLANKNNTNRITYDFLTTLRNYNYKESSKIYESLYSWKAKIIINDSETNSSIKKASLSRYDTVYCHITLQGGPPGEEVSVRAVSRWPDGGGTTVNWDNDKWRRGHSGCAYFWLDYPDTAVKGTFKISFYAGSALAGEASVRIT